MLTTLSNSLSIDFCRGRQLSRDFENIVKSTPLSYVSFYGDVLMFVRKRMDVNKFRGICGFRKI